MERVFMERLIYPRSLSWSCCRFSTMSLLILSAAIDAVHWPAFLTTMLPIMHPIKVSSQSSVSKGRIALVMPAISTI